ncbi:MAG TPA: hypothetical protein VHO69_10520 [Phototrophicaceae bacterium]|nr:hypothetical protein [Phototrophicaceae bacterium]
MNLPGNIYERLFDSASTVWQQAQTSSMQRFLAEYTLHDSEWLGLQAELYGEAVALFDWDLVWANWEAQRIDIPRIVFPGGSIGWERPAYLAILFTRLYYAVSARKKRKYKDDHYSVLAGAESRQVSAEQREKFLGLMLDVLGEDFAEFALDESLCCTVVEGISQDSIALYHAEPVKFLCLDKNGRIVPIPGID